MAFSSKIIFHIDLSQAKIVRVGNSVSIRSLAILKAPSSLGLKWESYFGFYHEDGFLCAQYYDYLSARGFTYAPVELAYKFSC